MKKIALIAIAVAGIHYASQIDKERLLIECVEGTEGSDTDCEQCYYEVYGERLK
jgi:hypothetical protein